MNKECPHCKKIKEKYNYEKLILHIRNRIIDRGRTSDWVCIAFSEK